MQVVEHPQEMAERARAIRAQGQRIGFVPTMGFLHAGHTSLMDLARARCDVLVASIYVNPLQFAPHEDLDRYPRDPVGDARKCAEHGVDLLFMPDSLYPPGHATRVEVRGVTDRLCGASRPHFFGGVATVVARLFGIVQPQLAVFGEKDYQQLLVIRRMAEDLALGVEVLGGPLVRDTDGVALSSRNAYLSPADRARAASLSRALFGMQRRWRAGDRDVARLIAEAEAAIDADRLDYLELLDAESLAPLGDPARPARAFVAAFYGATRLIDNVGL